MTCLFLAVASIGVVGCGDGRPSRVPVSGQVLIDGKPLDTGYIRFLSENSRAATGKIDPQGRFTLGTYEADDGIVPGVHEIEISAQESVGDDSTRYFAPKKYASTATSGLTQEITGPTDSLVITLSWDGKPGPYVEVNR